MKIGTFLTLEYNSAEGEPEDYYCKLIDADEENLYIDYPIRMETKRTSIFPRGAAFLATYKGGDDCIYQFSTEIIAKVNRNVPAISIKKPLTVKRIQRREFVRVEAAADMAVHILGKENNTFVTVTGDISGGGVSFFLPKNVHLDAGQTLDICIVLINGSGHKYIRTNAEVVHSRTDHEGVTTSSAKFTSIHPADQQEIIRFCFEKQRETRKKELL
ncbi:flagellar brake protein [Virgibacillus sediminis]|uniref:Flagellar brake protein n=1 Tax=Virgibacillus sediminis TaxID=202260 RepID=A0ABV7A616_9BACI